ncbi:MAG TPA: hypothetical protein VKE94_20845 [Gemmataceae bacterium]|nr:hypothetical protein [Gemmataceae bacterium]
MNRRELWLAGCVLGLVAGVGVGRAQDKTPPEAVPMPVVVSVPALPTSPALQCVSLEAVGCKLAAPAVQARCPSCTGCAACAQSKSDDCCGECAKCKRDTFASEGADEPAAPKKVKKIKRTKAVDYFQIAVPAPPIPVAQPGAPIAVYAPVPIGTCPNNLPIAMPPPLPPTSEPVMVFRAAAFHETCGHEDKSCGSSVRQTKHESSQSIAVGIGLKLAGGLTPVVQLSTVGQLEIECSDACKATCQNMTLRLANGEQLTIAPVGKQVAVTGPSLKATCDTLARTNANGALSLLLQGHVHLHHGKTGMKAEIESEQVRIVLHDGLMELHTFTLP